MIATATVQDEIQPDTEETDISDSALLESLQGLPERSPKTRPTRATSLTQLLDLAEVLYDRLMQERLEPVDHAALARAFCLIDERIRIRKGIPLPGQLRPDLVPGKRGKREPILNAQSFSEAVEAPKTPQEPVK